MIRAIIFDFGRVISAQKPPSLFRRYEKELGLAPGTLNPIMFRSQVWQEALLGRKTAEEPLRKSMRSVAVTMGMRRSTRVCWTSSGGYTAPTSWPSYPTHRRACSDG
jgi:hypothetical protein